MTDHRYWSTDKQRWIYPGEESDRADLMRETADRIESEISCCDGYGMSGSHETGCIVTRLRVAANSGADGDKER